MSLKPPKKLSSQGMVVFVNAAAAHQKLNMITLHPFLAVEKAMLLIFSCYAFNAIEVNRIVVPVKFMIGRWEQIVVTKTQL